MKLDKFCGFEHFCLERAIGIPGGPDFFHRSNKFL